MSGELIPELHDIGKMVDNDALNAALPDLGLWGHCFTADDKKTVPLYGRGWKLPENSTWQGILAHLNTVSPRTELQQCMKDHAFQGQKLHRRTFYDLADLYHLMLADHLAASTSRAVGSLPRGLTDLSSKVLHKLWRYPHAVEALPGGRYPVSTPQELEALLQWLATDPGSEEFMQRFDAYLRVIPEEKGFPNSVTSLRTHCLLVGKFHRVLRRHTRLDERRQTLVYAGQVCKTWNQMEQQWVFRLVRCQVVLPHRPARSKDLGVFKRLEAIFDAFEADEERRDYLLMRTLDTAWLFTPLESELPLTRLLTPLLAAGFPVRARSVALPLRLLSGALQRLTEQPPASDQQEVQEAAFYGQLSSEIPPPLCSQCQMMHGTQLWEDERSAIVESLCRNCYETRARYGDSFRKLARWEDEGAGVAWLRFTLDDAALHRLLPKLFRRYIDQRVREASQTLSEMERERLVANLRSVALAVDFTEEYLQFLSTFASHVTQEFGEERAEELTARRKELLVIALTRSRDVLKIAEIFSQALSATFPSCPYEVPISLTMSLGNAKHLSFSTGAPLASHPWVCGCVWPAAGR